MNNEDAGEASAVPPSKTEEKVLSETNPVEMPADEAGEASLKDSAEDAEEAVSEIAATEEENPVAAVETSAGEETAETTEGESDDNIQIEAKDVSPHSPSEISASSEAAKLESPIFKELAAPKLPALAAENRARLQMQSPNRIFFYWSIKNNPYRTLQKALGAQAQNYRLVARLVNLGDEREEIYPVEPDGSWWFDVDSGAAYRAEVGFYAPRRPFVRLVFSNTVETPRAAPSPNLDASPAFAVSASEFAEALDASGYRQDAFDIVLAGDDAEATDEAATAAFEQIAGNVFDPAKFAAAELRYVLYALATGTSLEDLRAEMTPLLFDYLVNILEEHPEALDAENVLPIWESNFGTERAEEIRAPRLSASVFGASSINFPRLTGRRKPKLSPVSSFR